jgi:hypothetical protein
MRKLDMKFLSIGIVLLAFGILLVYGLFSHPEYFIWIGLGGVLALLSPFLAIILGIGFIYGSFSREEVPPMAPQTDFLIDERIDIEGARHVAQETSICKQHLLSGEKLLAIVLGEVEGRPELDHLALTDRRIIFYSSGKSEKPMILNHEEIKTVKGKKGKVLTHLGEINLNAKRKTVRFKNILAEYVDEIVQKMNKKYQHA